MRGDAGEPLSLDDEPTSVAHGHPYWKTLRQGLSRKARWGIISGGTLLAIVVIASVVYLASSKKTGDDARSNEPASDSKSESASLDHDAYVQDLMRKIPYDVEGFKKAGYTALENEKDRVYPHYFSTLTISIKPVFLSDSITKKSGYYTKAKMFAAYPTQTSYVGSPSGAWRHAAQSALSQTGWIRVVMLP